MTTVPLTIILIRKMSYRFLLEMGFLMLATVKVTLIVTKIVMEQMLLSSRSILEEVDLIMSVNTLTHVMVTSIVMVMWMELMPHFLKMTLAEVTSTTPVLLVR